MCLTLNLISQMVLLAQMKSVVVFLKINLIYILIYILHFYKSHLNKHATHSVLSIGYVSLATQSFIDWVKIQNLPFRNKALAKMWLHQLRRDRTFYDKTLKNVYVCNEHFIEDCYEVSYRYKMLGAKIKKEETKTRCCSKNQSFQSSWHRPV